MNQAQHPYAPPAVQEAPPPSPPPQRLRPHDPATAGERLAGALLVANAVLVLVEFVLLPREVAGPGPSVPPILPAIIDAAIGSSLLRGKRQFVGFAIVRIVIGLLFGLIMRGVQLDWFAVAAQAAVSGALLLLLIGDAKPARRLVASGLFGLYVLVELAGVAILASGVNPIAVAAAAVSDDDTPATEVRGAGFGYRLTLPEHGWYLRSAEVTKAQNAIADRWAFRPAKDAHVLVIAEQVEPGTLDLDSLTEAVLANARQSSKSLTVVAQGPLPGRQDARLLRTRAVMDGLTLEHAYGLFLVDDVAYQVTAFALPGTFAELETELLGVVGSFQVTK